MNRLKQLIGEGRAIVASALCLLTCGLLAPSAQAAEPAPEKTVMDRALEALAKIENPAEVYLWSALKGKLVDISDEWTKTTTTDKKTYGAPVIFTGKGPLVYRVHREVSFDGGLAAPNATSLDISHNLDLGDVTKPVTIKGELRGGIATDDWRFYLKTDELTLNNVLYRGQVFNAVTDDRTLNLAGTNDFSGAVMSVGVDSLLSDPKELFVTNLVAEADAALKLRRLHFTTNGIAAEVLATLEKTAGFTVGKNVTLLTSEDILFGIKGATLTVDGTLEAAGVNIAEDIPGLLPQTATLNGAGMVKTTHFGMYAASTQYVGVATLVLQSAVPYRGYGDPAGRCNVKKLEDASMKVDHACLISIDARNIPTVADTTWHGEAQDEQRTASFVDPLDDRIYLPKSVPGAELVYVIDDEKAAEGYCFTNGLTTIAFPLQKIIGGRVSTWLPNVSAAEITAAVRMVLTGFTVNGLDLLGPEDKSGLGWSYDKATGLLTLTEGWNYVLAGECVRKDLDLGVTVDAGYATVVLSNATITSSTLSPLKINAIGVNLHLLGENTLTAPTGCAAMAVPSGKSVKIAHIDPAMAGRLVAVGGEGAPAIGGEGDVTVESGVVTAKGGIAASNVRIEGGTVTAQGSGTDIGGNVVITRGSILAGNVTSPKNEDGDAVWCVTLPGVKHPGPITLSGLDYGAADLYPIDRELYLWLPNEEYEIVVKDKDDEELDESFYVTVNDGPAVAFRKSFNIAVNGEFVEPGGGEHSDWSFDPDAGVLQLFGTTDYVIEGDSTEDGLRIVLEDWPTCIITLKDLHLAKENLREGENLITFGEGSNVELVLEGQTAFKTNDGIAPIRLNKDAVLFLSGKGKVYDWAVDLGEGARVRMTDPKALLFASKESAEEATKTIKPAADRDAFPDIDQDEYAKLFDVGVVTGTRPATWMFDYRITEATSNLILKAFAAAETNLVENLFRGEPSVALDGMQGLYYGLAGATESNAVEAAAVSSWRASQGGETMVCGETFPGCDRPYYQLRATRDTSGSASVIGNVVRAPLPVVVTTNGLEVADAAVSVSYTVGGTTSPLPADGIVPTNATVKVIYTIATQGRYFSDGQTTCEVTFTADKAVNEAGARITKPAALGKPTLKLGVVAQRYPWNGIVDVNYKATYWPAGNKPFSDLEITIGETVFTNAFEILGTGEVIDSLAIDMKEIAPETISKAKIKAFAYIPSTSIDVRRKVSPAAGGVVVGGQQCAWGAETEITAVANNGYLFDGWSDGVMTQTRTVTADGKVYQANFHKLLQVTTLGAKQDGCPFFDQVYSFVTNGIDDASSPYKDWAANFFVSFSKKIPAMTLKLATKFNGEAAWNQSIKRDDLEADTEYELVDAGTYGDLCDKKKLDFGVWTYDNRNLDTTMTVWLKMTNGAETVKQKLAEHTFKELVKVIIRPSVVYEETAPYAVEMPVGSGYYVITNFSCSVTDTVLTMTGLRGGETVQLNYLCNFVSNANENTTFLVMSYPKKTTKGAFRYLPEVIPGSMDVCKGFDYSTKVFNTALNRTVGERDWAITEFTGDLGITKPGAAKVSGTGGSQDVTLTSVTIDDANVTFVATGAVESVIAEPTGLTLSGIGMVEVWPQSNAGEVTCGHILGYSNVTFTVNTVTTSTDAQTATYTATADRWDYVDDMPIGDLVKHWVGLPSPPVEGAGTNTLAILEADIKLSYVLMRCTNLVEQNWSMVSSIEKRAESSVLLLTDSLYRKGQMIPQAFYKYQVAK